jgi:hypothetical protein
VETDVRKELERSGTLKVIGEENVVAASGIFGDSMSRAHAASDEWTRKTSDEVPAIDDKGSDAARWGRLFR